MKRIAMIVLCRIVGHPSPLPVKIPPSTDRERFFGGRTITISCRRCGEIRARIEEPGELALAA
jgi:hypothetical protein